MLALSTRACRLRALQRIVNRVNSTNNRPIREIATGLTPELLAENLQDQEFLVLLRSSLFDSPEARYSFVTARPFLTFRSSGSRCELRTPTKKQILFGDPWHLLESLMLRYELLDEMDLPFPLGGCFGHWGYDLKNFVEPKLSRRAVNDLELPDCHVGFYDSLVVFDHRLGKTWIVSTGLREDGSRSESFAQKQFEFWQCHLEAGPLHNPKPSRTIYEDESQDRSKSTIISNLSRADFLERVVCAQDLIRSGEIYQVNLSQRLAASLSFSSWKLFQSLSAVSPASFS